ncbi:MAG: hypothetical protein LBP20_00625 [Treponema sp.]|jgi:hypothetical protein|nr:hypothetical protein [Treponema sp.]
MKKKSEKLRDLLADHFSDVWKLLSETSIFLSRTGEFGQYENQLRGFRARLQRCGKTSEQPGIIRSELIELRRNLRILGYDLSLGGQNLIFDGFRHDDSMAEGFRRLVLFIGDAVNGDTGVYWYRGDENHIALAGFLEERLKSAGGRPLRIRNRHYLWYRRRKTELILSGSDTETRDDYERLKAAGEANPLLFLSKLKNLR